MKFDTLPQQAVWFRDQYKSGHLILKPPFQRKPVWAAKQKCYLIESMLLQMPVPEIFVQQSLQDESPLYAVVDGQQRIRALLQFLGIDDDATEADYNGFALDKLAATSPYRDRSYSQLDKSDRDNLLRYVFSVRMLDEPDDGRIRDLFIRLNRYLTKLSDQELRNATYTGPFVRLSTHLADDDYWVDNKLVSAAQIRRMKDVEFMSDLMIGVLHGPQGGSARVIDEYYQRYEDYEDEFPNQKAVTKRFSQSKAAIVEIFPKLLDVQRWNNRTDYYSLFVALGVLQMEYSLANRGVAAVREALVSFAKKVDQRLTDESFKTGDDVVRYVRAVEKGANDKKRRADRHQALLDLLRPHLAKKKGT